MIRELYGFILKWMMDLQVMVMGPGDGEGEQIMEPTLSQTLYFAPDGTSWTSQNQLFL